MAQWDTGRVVPAFVEDRANPGRWMDEEPAAFVDLVRRGIDPDGVFRRGVWPAPAQLAPANMMIAYAWPTFMGAKSDWAYQTTPQLDFGGQSGLMPRGCVVGGSSQINGMLWTRGDPD